jgi:murein DD-endopeptidase MepM/ murein hydrolase activator NlpD
MRRLALIAVLFLGSASPALADDSGGAAAPGSTIPTKESGGTSVGEGAAPLAHLFARHSAGVPRIRVRFEEPGVSSVVARVVVLRGSQLVSQIQLGRVAVGRVVTVPWHLAALPAGRYLVRVHARDRWNNQLRRSGRTTGKVTLDVKGSAAPPTAPPSSPPSSSGVFPVAGPFTYGEGIGADRGDHRHEGQDLAAPAGTPVVAPLGGTVASVAYQADGAGYYVVLNATDGRSFFFAHCQKGSIGVSTGQVVTTGAGLCRVGSTGASSGPHLHFEIWVDGWRVSKKSAPIDPLPQLRAWAS